MLGQQKMKEKIDVKENKHDKAKRPKRAYTGIAKTEAMLL